MKSRSTRVISYGETGSGADLALLDRIPHAQGQTLKLSVFGARYEIQAPVAGAFQAETILCALGLAVGTEVPVERAVAGIGRLSPVPGRLELAAVLGNGAAVYVDYAHTPDALHNVLRSVRPHVGANAKLHVLFGCGGDRDRGKRPIMGKIAGTLADLSVVTSDNPRSEDPEAIITDVMAGLPPGAPHLRVADRREAIRQTLQEARGGDTVLLAGKGHETYQVIGKEYLPFDEKEIVAELLGVRGQGSGDDR
jgi:UDP-N-acetylmuramoyl-L-alanyl-D-glutamate--2,6-diaminopimelate ligase